MLNKFQTFLRLARITDEDNTVSLSSLLMWVMAVKVALSPACGLPELSCLFLALLNYNARKFWQSRRHKYSDETLAALNNLNAKIDHTNAQVQVLHNAGSMANIVNQFRGQ